MYHFITKSNAPLQGEPGASIERLTEDFVTGLQADYQSTISNIVR